MPFNRKYQASFQKPVHPTDENEKLEFFQLQKESWIPKKSSSGLIYIESKSKDNQQRENKETTPIYLHWKGYFVVATHMNAIVYKHAGETRYLYYETSVSLLYFYDLTNQDDFMQKTS